MLNNNPESNRAEADQAAALEKAREQLEAGVFADAKEREAAKPERNWTPNPSSEHADKVSEIVSPDVHTEAGIELAQEIPVHERPANLNRLLEIKGTPEEKAERIRNSDLSGHDQ